MLKKSKMQVYQVVSKSKSTFLVYRYFDKKNNNFAYQIYKLVKSKSVAKEFGVSEFKEGRKTKLNTREMCDIMIENILNNKDA